MKTNLSNVYFAAIRCSLGNLSFRLVTFIPSTTEAPPDLCPDQILLCPLEGGRLDRRRCNVIPIFWSGPRCMCALGWGRGVNTCVRLVPNTAPIEVSPRAHCWSPPPDRRFLRPLWMKNIPQRRNTHTQICGKPTCLPGNPGVLRDWIPSETHSSHSVAGICIESLEV